VDGQTYGRTFSRPALLGRLRDTGVQTDLPVVLLALEQPLYDCSVPDPSTTWELLACL